MPKGGFFLIKELGRNFFKGRLFNVKAKKEKKTVNAGIGELVGDFEASIINGPYSDIVDPDSYVELDVNMTCSLNKDWFIYENYKYYCSLLLVGAVLLEVYGRISLTDPYYETSKWKSRNHNDPPTANKFEI